MAEKWIRSPFLFLGIFIFYFIGLWGMSVPMTGDQKTYLSIAMEMRARGEWIIPYLFGTANFLKPPFQYWATIMGWKLFGFNTLGALLPSVFALLGTAAFTKKIFEYLTGKNGSVVALLFAASLGTMTYGTTAQMEIWIVFFYVASWYFAITSRDFWALTFVGIMAWVKGPLYPVLWVMSFIFYQLLQKNGKALVRPRFIGALVLGVGVGLAWFFAAAQTHQQEMLAVFFQRENFQKMGGNQSSPQSLWGEFFYTLLPWGIFFVAVIFKNQWWRAGASKKSLIFYFCYSFLPAVFFTVFPYRVNTYLYLLTPIAACIAVQGAEKLNRNALRVMGVVASLVGSVLIFILVRLVQGEWITPWIAAPLVLVIMLWAFFHFSGNLAALALLSLCMVNLIRVGGVEIGEGDLADLRAYVNRENQNHLAYLIEDKDIWHEYGMISAALGKEIHLTYSREEADQFVESGGALILNEQQAGTGVCESWTRLKRRLKFPLVQLLTQGVSMHDPSLTREFKICHKKM